MNNLYTMPIFSEEINSILSGYRTHEEAIQKISEKPENLINFLEVISNKNNEWYLKNSIDFYTTLKKINILHSEDAFNQNQVTKIAEILDNNLSVLVESKTQLEIYVFFNRIIRKQPDEVKLKELSARFDVNFEEGCDAAHVLRLPHDKTVELIFNKFEAAKTIENFSILGKSLPVDMLYSILGKIMRADINWFLENLTTFNYLFYFKFDNRNIIDFFKLICDHSLSNSKNLNTFLKTISESPHSFNSFGSGPHFEALNRNDIKNIIEIRKIINSFPSVLLKVLFNQFFKNIMNEHFHVISIIERTGNVSLTIKSTLNLENLQWYVQNLSEVYLDKEIKIHFSPTYGEKSKIRQFMQEQGQWITAVDWTMFWNLENELMVYQMDDDMMQDMIKLCPKISELSIASSRLISQGLQQGNRILF